MINEPVYQWTPVNLAAPFAPHDGAGALVFKDRMWLIGGWNPGDEEHFPRICSNDVWYSADGVEWHEVPATPWAERHAASVFVFGGGAVDGGGQ